MTAIPVSRLRPPNVSILFGVAAPPAEDDARAIDRRARASPSCLLVELALRPSSSAEGETAVEGGGAMVIGYWVGGSLIYDSQISSTSSDWGSGSTNNSPEDVWVDAYDTSYSYGTSASFTCAMSAGGCY